MGSPVNRSTILSVYVILKNTAYFLTCLTLTKEGFAQTLYSIPWCNVVYIALLMVQTTQRSCGVDTEDMLQHSAVQSVTSNVYHKVGLQHFTLNITCSFVSLFHSSSSLVLLEGNITCLHQFLTDDDCTIWLLSLNCSTASTKSVERLSLKLSTSPLSRFDRVRNWCRKVQCLEGSFTCNCEVFNVRLPP